MTNSFPLLLLVSLTPFLALLTYALFLRRGIRADRAAEAARRAAASDPEAGESDAVVVGRRVRLRNGSVVELRSEVTIGASGQHV